MKHDGMIKKRTVWLGIAVGFYFLALFVRLLFLQIVNPQQFAAHAEASWTRNLPIEGQRGIIYDRNMNVIVTNVVAPSVLVIPRQVTDFDAIANLLADVLESDFETMLEKASKPAIVNKIHPEGRKLNHLQVMAIKEADFDGVFLVNDVMRYYPHGNLLAHTLGFTGIDNDGLAGLEALLNEKLLGTEGAWQYFSNAKGHPLERFSDLYSPSSRGMDIVTTINLDLQKLVEREADIVMARYRPQSLQITIMCPRTNAILATTTRPTFDPANYQDYDQEIFNRNLPVYETFELGSTFKVPVYAAALELGLFNLADPFNCGGYAIIDGNRIRCWKSGGHGSISMLDVLVNSCNPGFMRIGVDLLGKERLFEFIEKFGFTEKTGVDILGENLGLTFNPDLIGPVETATSAFGQGNSASAMQLMSAVAATINGGYLMRPHIVQEIRHPYTQEILFLRQPEVRRRVISQETSDIMRHALEVTGARGGGRNAHIDGFRVGGKTGTSQVPVPGGGYADGEYILSFIGAAPMDDPQLLIYVAVNRPQDTIQYGGVVAAPIARNILVDALPLIGVEKRTEQMERSYIWGDPIYMTVADYIGKERDEIEKYTTYEIQRFGNGNVVIDQQPRPGARIPEDGVIRLFFGN